MHFVTDEFLDDLEMGRGEKSAVTDVWVDRKSRYFDVEVISDLVVAGPKAHSGIYSDEEINRLRGDLVSRVTDLRRAFQLAGEKRSGSAADLLVNCGDLVGKRNDRSASELHRVQAAYREICLPALRDLQGGADGKILGIPGDQDSYAGGGRIRGPWEAPPEAAGEGSHPYYTHLASGLAANDLPKRPEEHPVTSIFRVLELNDTSSSAGLGDEPLACVAVVGFDSNDIQYKYDLAANYGQIGEEQLNRARRLIGVLRSKVARSTPLYLIAVTHHNLLPTQDRLAQLPRGANDEHYVRFRAVLDVPEESSNVCEPTSRFCVTNHFLAESTSNATSNASGFLNHLLQLRTSLLVHSNMQQRAAATVTSAPLVTGQSPRQLDIVTAPALSTGRPTSGMARIRLDLWKGDAEIAFKYDAAEDGGPADKPVQMNRRLVSASRVSSGERRLYGKVRDLIAAALENKTTQSRSEIERFAEYVGKVWAEHGYAAVSFADGKLPADLGPATRQNRYHLLLLLREAEGGNYELLLSRHTPLKPSDMAEWGTLLMPAFSNVRDLMDRLRLDVVRQVSQAEDLERAASAKRFDEAVEALQDGDGGQQDDIWQDKLREIATDTKRKISPTSGTITDYEYRLVVLTPFVRDTREITTFDASPETRTELALVEWLTELPSVRLPGAPLGGRQELPMEAIMSGGAGLRWDPTADPVNPDEASEDDERRRRAFPPGAVWFPLQQAGDASQPWELAPSIVARNADVMRWVSGQLRDRLAKDGTYPPHVVLGAMRESSGYDLADGPFPFDGVPFAADPTTAAYVDARTRPLSVSTTEAMARVEFIHDFDLRGQRPYADLQIRRVVLVRRVIPVPSGRERDVICVFDASQPPSGKDLSYFLTIPESERLGLLRPAQRYVLQAGLDRAGWVNDYLSEKCIDPWGFLRATYGGAGEPIALTPPIIEQVTAGDVDTDDGRYREFVVCDGNHRVVTKVWNSGEAAAAIGVVGEPREPYYARPFSPYEWDMTADNPLAVTPDVRFKHAPRSVPWEGLSEPARKELQAIPPERRYRRYYRDLSLGFGPMGGQGGRYV
ncbi:conserved hypothetical protein [Frankia sp. Hr75.2]|nr:conserved hypothetical protein [Frankia sp. Hr75.2]